MIFFAKIGLAEPLPAASENPGNNTPGVVVSYPLNGTLDAKEGNFSASGSPVFRDGPFPEEKALLLGDNSIVAFPVEEETDYSEGMTIGFWLWLDPEEIVGGTKEILQWGSALNVTGVALNGNWPRLEVSLQTSEGDYELISRTVVPTGEWIRVVLSYTPLFEPVGHLHAADLQPVHGSTAGLFTMVMVGIKDEPFGRSWRAKRAEGEFAPDTKEIRVGGNNHGAVRVHGFELSNHYVSVGETTRRGLAELERAGRSVSAIVNIPADAGEAEQERTGEVVAIELVPTFHNIGAYLLHDGLPRPDQTRSIRYRIEGETEWKLAPPPVLDAVAEISRGSILEVPSDRTVEVEAVVSLPGKPEEVVGRFAGETHTWPEEVPIGEVRELPERSDQPLVISDQGQPDAWILYRPAPGKTARIEAGEQSSAAVLFHDAAYVIFENVEIRGGRTDAVDVVRSNFIRIRNCDIAEWGRPGTRKEGLPKGLYVDEEGELINNQVGVRLSHESRGVVIENNFIHSPRATANSWEYNHPLGPMGILTHIHGGQAVVRNNDVIGSERHWWNDAIQGAANASPFGGPYRDMDIHGNILAFANDDATELDGGQINVRYYENRIEICYVGLSTAPNVRGPSYVYDNLIAHLGDERGIGGVAFKMGTGIFPLFGVTFMWHNTVATGGHALNAPHTAGRFTRLEQWDELRASAPIYAENNIFEAGRIRYPRRIGLQQSAVFRNNMMRKDAIEENVVKLENPIDPPAVYADPDRGNFRLAADSSGRGAAIQVTGLQSGTLINPMDLGVRFQDGDLNFPPRPVELAIEPERVVIESDSSGTMTTEVLLHCPESVGDSWWVISNSPWLECSPETGPASGDPIPVTITVTPEKPGLHRGALTFRTDQGFNRTLLIHFKAPDSVTAEIHED